jgi:hypothetical protein
MHPFAVTKDRIEQFIAWAAADAGHENAMPWFRQVCTHIRRLETVDDEQTKPRSYDEALSQESKP